MLGIICLGVTGFADLPAGIASALLIFGLVMVAVGMLVAGSLLTQILAQILVSRAHCAAQLIGCAQIVRHPRQTFRSVAGVLIAGFTVTVFAVGITSVNVDKRVPTGPDYLSTTVLVTHLGESSGTQADHLADELRQMPGISRAVVAHWQDDGTDSGSLMMAAEDARSLGGIDRREPEWTCTDR